MKEALKEILRIVQTNGGLHKGDEINITYCTGLWRIEPIAKDALRKEAQPNARLIAAAPEMHEVLSELLDTLELSKDYGFDDEYEKVRAVLAKVGGEKV